MPIRLPSVPAEIGIWQLTLERLVTHASRLAGWLSRHERERAGRLHFELDRAQFVAGRAALRWLLGRRLRCDAASLELIQGPMGKPLLAPGTASSLHFNLSHSDGLAIYALSANYELGVDVERIRPVLEAESILRNHFPPEVLSQWRAIPPYQQPVAFFESWVRREAIVKREGCGLAGLEVSPELAASPGSVIPFIPADGYVGALAFRDAASPN